MERSTVESLIICGKKILSPPKKNDYPDARNIYTLRNDFSCKSDDGIEFEVFMRHNIKLAFIFSIGLKYKSPEGEFILCRYNGKHLHKNKIGDHNSFDNFHIHKLYDIQLSDNTSDELDAEVTKKYLTYNSALLAFLDDCHIEDWRRYFPNLEMQVQQLRIGGA